MARKTRNGETTNRRLTKSTWHAETRVGPWMHSMMPHEKLEREEDFKG
jgi:hypothetical protein